MKLKTVPAKVSLLFVRPTIVAATECPHCKELNFTEIDDGQKKKTILDSCNMCGNEYQMKIPDFNLEKV